MSIAIRWNDEAKSAVFLEYEAPWTWDDLYESIDSSKAMMSESEQAQVDIIVHMKDAYLPKGGSLNMHGMSAIRNPHPKLRYIIVITENTFIRTLMSVSSKVSPQVAERYVVVRNIEEALRLHSKRDQLLTK
jgi:hypothetical protein